MHSRCVWSPPNFLSNSRLNFTRFATFCFAPFYIINSDQFISIPNILINSRWFYCFQQARSTEVQISLNMPYFHEVDSIPQPISNLVANTAWSHWNIESIPDLSSPFLYKSVQYLSASTSFHTFLDLCWSSSILFWFQTIKVGSRILVVKMAFSHRARGVSRQSVHSSNPPTVRSSSSGTHGTE